MRIVYSQEEVGAALHHELRVEVDKLDGSLARLFLLLLFLLLLFFLFLFLLLFLLLPFFLDFLRM